MSKSINKIVLAYSGGLDTSVMLRWLKDKYQCEIVCYCADVGQGAEDVYRRSTIPMAKPELKLKEGDEAPDFTLPSTSGDKVKLSDFRGKKNVVLAFFPAAFTGG